MENHLDDFISESVDILVDLLKGKDFETVRRINYLVNRRPKEIIERA